MFHAPLKLSTLFRRGADASCVQILHFAVLRDTPDVLGVVRRVVERGTPVNEIKYEHDTKLYRERKPFGLGTALHRVAEPGKKDIVIYLLEQGADPLKLDSRGKTPSSGGKAITILMWLVFSMKRKNPNLALDLIPRRQATGGTLGIWEGCSNGEAGFRERSLRAFWYALFGAGVLRSNGSSSMYCWVKVIGLHCRI